MTNKMPVVGKRYRLKNTNIIARILPIISVIDENTKCVTEYGVDIFNEIYEELKDSLQEKKEATIIFQTPDEPSLGFNSPTWSDVGAHSVRLEKGQVNEVTTKIEFKGVGGGGNAMPQDQLDKMNRKNEVEAASVLFLTLPSINN